jgi:hypothetical protein
MKGTPNKTVSRAKSAKNAKVDVDKKTWNGRGLCELSVLGAINSLEVLLFNICGDRIYLSAVFPA